MSDRTIKPCPFCGSAVELEHHMGSMGSWGYSYDFAEIECTQCRIKLVEDTEAWERGRGTYCIRKEAEEKLIKRWNTRHDVREETAVEGES